jgi:HEPN domain-containing protein
MRHGSLNGAPSNRGPLCCIATRYPDDLAKIQAVYSEEVAKDMIAKSKDVMKWIKAQL